MRTQLECVLITSITSMKIKVQIEPTTIASIKVKPCGERKCCALVDRSAADGTAVRNSAYLLYVLLLFAPGPLVTLLEGQFSLAGRLAYSAHSTA